MKDVILKHVLLNALQYEGKADFKAVVGKIISENPKVKDSLGKLIPEIKKTIEEVNSWGVEKVEEKVNELRIEVEKKTEEKQGLPDLPDAEKGKVVTAFPPEPSKYPHIGHAKAAFINYMYAKKYEGKFICRFEDTNPDLAKEEYYDAILDGLKWLGIEWDGIDYITDHIEKYYEATEKLIKDDKAYICFCKPEDTKRMRRDMEECGCRGKLVEENSDNWGKMLSGEIKEGEASVRLKVSMEHKNAAMRDPSIMRIIDKEHVRTGNKFRVWPMYDFGTSMMDSWGGITHRIRSKEFEMRTEIQVFIQDALGLKSPKIIEIARFNLEGVPSSGREIREMFQKGELLGWDDPRLTTLMALKRRGFLPEAIREFLLSTGVSKSESVLTWSILESFNRKIVGPTANRYFAVFDPVEIDIEDCPEVTEASEDLHPNYPERGSRSIPVNPRRIFISKEDFEKYKGREVRLIGLFNVGLGEKVRYHSDEIVQEMPKIQWVSEKNVPLKIVMDDGMVKEGLGEPEIENLNEDDILQFMRFGFCRLDDKKEMKFYFTHK